jgi:hypothetical protein
LLLVAAVLGGIVGGMLLRIRLHVGEARGPGRCSGDNGLAGLPSLAWLVLLVTGIRCIGSYATAGTEHMARLAAQVEHASAD